MLEFSQSALVDADIILYVTDVVENIEKNMDFIEKVNRDRKRPVFAGVEQKSTSRRRIN